MIGWAFNQLFLAGDVIYGISRPRGRYTRTLEQGITGKSAQTLIDEGNFTICDHYNNRTFNAPTVMSKFNGPNVMPGNQAVDEYLNGIAPYRPGQVQSLTPYYDRLSMHKYNPHDALNLVMNEKQRRNNGGDNNYLAFRRACKFGLDYFILQMGRRVHFILDVDDHGTCINFEQIVFKELFVNQGNNNKATLPITYSELRKCYKNRVIYGNKLFFYLNCVRVAAPWDQNPELWAWIDRAKELKANPPIDLIELIQNGREVRQTHFVPAPKLSKLEKLKRYFK